MTEPAAAPPSVRDFEPGLTPAWEGVIERAPMGTMMHTRRFVSYHGDRFRDRSLVLEDRRGKVVGVLPAAEDPHDPHLVISHPGLTFGGLVHDGSVHGAAMVGAMAQIAGHYRDLGYRRLRYKAIPAVYRSAPADDDAYALFRLGAQRYRCDLAAAIDLSHRGPVSRRRVRSLRRAEAAGVTTVETWHEIAGFWGVLEQYLAERHGAAPVHSFDEIQLLHDRFPDDILLISAKIGETLVGGYVFFCVGPAVRTQYTATTAEGHAAFAMDPVLERAIGLAGERGYRFFDFGTCTLDEGRNLVHDIYEFKISYGASGVAYDHYELDLCR